MPAFSAQTEENTLGPQLTAAMDFCDWITKNVDVPDEVFNKMRGFLNNQQLVEATATTGFYAFVSRFVEALDVDGKVNTLVPIPK
jgi:alkylhydroperoxidase family enzyme